MKHLIYIPWTGVGVKGGFRGDSWYKHRIEIFKNYTLKSLANQSNRDFTLWCSFRPEEEINPLTREIWLAIEAAGLKTVFTFNGLMYVDDKFLKLTWKTRIRNLLQMVWDCWHSGDWKSPSELWRYTWEDKNKSLPERLTASLSKLKNTIGQADWIYMTRLDSDDMLHREAVSLIQAQEPTERKALVMDKGYMYNTETGQVAEWLPPTCPPFTTVIFPGETFFDPEKHLSYYGTFTSHEDYPKVFNAETLDLYKYCVTAHGKDHISTAWDVPLLKKAYQQFKYRPYCYTTSGQNISTRYQSRTLKKRNMMLGYEFTNPQEKKDIMADFGIEL